MKATPRSGAAKSNGKGEGAEPYRQVYNWQFVHSLDFWSLVLATACDKEKETEEAKESDLRPLIYPLVQLTLGVIRYVPIRQSAFTYTVPADLFSHLLLDLSLPPGISP